METILASIRRIISEEEPAAVPAAGAHRHEPEDDDAPVELDESMIVRPAPSAPMPFSPTPSSAMRSGPMSSASERGMAEPEGGTGSRPSEAVPVDHDQPLLAPEARLAASRSLDSLHEALQPAPAPPSGLAVFRSGGPSLEDLVRDELRGQLKLWLDANLPEMVEKLVRAEIERVVRRG